MTKDLTARWRLPADADLVELVHAEQERIFMDDSGLGAARPDAHIRFCSPAGYLELIENVQIHGYHLMLDAGRALTREEIAADWYDQVYLPSVDAIREPRISRSCTPARPSPTSSSACTTAGASSTRKSGAYRSQRPPSGCATTRAADGVA